MPVNRKVATQPVLPVVIRAGPWVSPQCFQATAGIGHGQTAQFIPPDCRLCRAEPYVPFVIPWRHGDPVTALRTHP